MENSHRLAKALHEVLTEIVKIVHENSARTVQPIAAPTPAQVEQPALPERLLYPLPEAQQRLGGISRTTLYSLIGRGELAVVKIGNRSFITQAALTDFVTGLSQTTSTRN